MSPRDSDRELRIEKLRGSLIFWGIFLSTLLSLYLLGFGVIYILEKLLELWGA